MFSIPASRYFLYPVPWYSFLIALGACLAVLLASVEEQRVGLPKDTVIDLALWLIPFGIVGARVYYVIFSWDHFRDAPLSVFRIWEGGLAIYGAIIAGIIVLYCFCRRRRFRALMLCDVIAPGLVLAQSIGRWGNYFNMEAYGLPLSNPGFCFFPFAVQIAENYTYVWHMATFFYESSWDFLIFLFLLYGRRRFLSDPGDVFLTYIFLYAVGRFWIEDLRMDSLLAASSVRISQLLSAALCFAVLTRYLVTAIHLTLSRRRFLLLSFGSVSGLICSFLLFFHALSPSHLAQAPLRLHVILLLAVAVLATLAFLMILIATKEISHADYKD